MDDGGDIEDKDSMIEELKRKLSNVDEECGASCVTGGFQQEVRRRVL